MRAVEGHSRLDPTRALSGVLAALLVCLLVCGCDYARMKDDEAVNTYQTSMPRMDPKTIPVEGGLDLLKDTDPETLHNPVAYTQDSVERGRTAYGYYCIQCHGPRAEGYGTVGQSFSPLPTNLRESYVQDQSDGSLFRKVSLGYKREPPLAYTVSVEDRWAIINYIRSIAAIPK